jgi:oxygen-independent coproporphyrinogen-3 oxidase
VQNEVGIHAYSQAITAGRLATVKGYALTDDDRLRADIIEPIMCDFSVDLDAVCAPARSGCGSHAEVRAAPAVVDLRRRGRA